MADLSEPVPGAHAGAQETLRLADSYRAAALELLRSAPPDDPAARAPARFCAVHAIELYLDAFLRGLGESPCRLRAHGHDLSRRAALAIARGLGLRRKTALHLVRLTRERAYAASRYGPERRGAVCELNRLVASLEEVARKVRHAAAGRPPSDAAAA